MTFASDFEKLAVFYDRENADRRDARPKGGRRFDARSHLDRRARRRRHWTRRPSDRRHGEVEVAATPPRDFDWPREATGTLRGAMHSVK